MEWLIGIAALFVGAALGAGLVMVRGSARRAVLQADIATARARAEMVDQQSRQLLTELNRAREETGAAERGREAAERQTAVLNEQLSAKQKQFDEQRQILADAEKKLGDSFAALGAKALHANNEQFIALAKKTFEALMTEAKGDVEKKQQAIDAIIKPIRELLEKQNTAVADIEKKREVAYKGLEEQIKSIALSHEGLRTETGRLVTALRRPEQRGRWGEVQLRNAVELAGMTEHCDFEEQVTIWNGEGAQRPDMVVNLPGRGVIPVDSKVALDGYLDALQCADGEPKAECLRRHADQVEKHFKALANRRYWDGFEKAHAPQMVVMFMPLESALVAALDVKPDLHHDAMQLHVLIATPTLLVALLRAVAYGWQQDAIAHNAHEIAKAGAELYSRIQKFISDLEKVGRNLSQASNAYNTAIGSLESRVRPSIMRLKELHATADADIDMPPPIEIEIRPVNSPELKTLPQAIAGAASDASVDSAAS